jgi:hypothetical protein
MEASNINCEMYEHSDLAFIYAISKQCALSVMDSVPWLDSFFAEQF